MTKAEIKKEALRIMFATETIGRLNDVAGVEDYLDKMDGAIERAVVRICQARKAGIEKLTITIKVIQSGEPLADFEEREGYTIQELEEGIDLGNNVLAVDRVGLRIPKQPILNNVGYDQIDYKTITMFMPNAQDGTKVIVYYYPAMVEIPIENDEEITTLREDIQHIIPYFLKAEIYEEDEPSLSAQARNIFEGMLASVEMNTQTVQPQIIDVLWGSQCK